jgi:hypothetical protein
MATLSRKRERVFHAPYLITPLTLAGEGGTRAANRSRCRLQLPVRSATVTRSTMVEVPLTGPTDTTGCTTGELGLNSCSDCSDNEFPPRSPSPWRCSTSRTAVRWPVQYKSVQQELAAVPPPPVLQDQCRSSPDAVRMVLEVSELRCRPLSVRPFPSSAVPTFPTHANGRCVGADAVEGDTLARCRWFVVMLDSEAGGSVSVSKRQSCQATEWRANYGGRRIV